MKSLNILLPILLFATLYSCDPNFEDPDEIITVIPSVKEWLTDSSYFQIEMINGESTVISYSEYSSWSGTNGHASKGGIIDGWHVVQYEFIEQCFKSKELGSFYVKMEPSELNRHGNLLGFRLGNNFSFQCDMSDTSVYVLEVNDNWETVDIDPNGLLNSFESTVEILDTITINERVYNDVLKMKLLDWDDEWNDETITEFYYGKAAGLLQYQLHNGTCYSRIK